METLPESLTETILLNGVEFVPFLSSQEIQNRVQELGAAISRDYADKSLMVIGILNGAFVFAADLFRCIIVPAEISFIKLVSYKGTSSTGQVITAIGLDENLEHLHILIVEDIVDTGRTLAAFLPQLLQRNPATIKIASFLTKPDALQYPIKADYVGFEIPNRFVVGYGLDYDGIGRNLPSLFQLKVTETETSKKYS